MSCVGFHAKDPHTAQGNIQTPPNRCNKFYNIPPNIVDSYDRGNILIIKTTQTTQQIKLQTAIMGPKHGSNVYNPINNKSTNID